MYLLRDADQLQRRSMAANGQLLSCIVKFTGKDHLRHPSRRNCSAGVADILLNPIVTDKHNMFLQESCHMSVWHVCRAGIQMLWQGERTDLRATMTVPGPSQSPPGHPSAQHQSSRGTLPNLLQCGRCQTVQALALGTGGARSKDEHDAIGKPPQWQYGVWTGTWTGHSASMGMKITACQTMQSTFTLHAGIEQHAAAVCGCCCQHVTTWVPRHCSHAAAVALPD